jgi:YaiO family outer membrane protein
MRKSMEWSRSAKVAGPIRILALVLALVAWPAAAATESGRVASEPAVSADTANPQERFNHAQALARRGDFAAALPIYAQLSQEHPGNVDYLFGEAQVLFRSGDAPRALERAAAARRLAPDYEDVWMLEYRILRSLSAADDRRLRDFRAAAKARFPGAGWLEAGPERGATWHWESGLNREHLSNGADDWQSLYLYADRQTPDDDVLSLTLSEHRRFSLIDHEVALGVGATVASMWIFDGTLRLAPGADFLATTVVDAGIGRILGGGWIAGIDLGHRRYPDESVDMRGFHVERYFGRFRSAYRLQSARLAGESSLTHIGVLNYFSDSGSRYGLTVAAGDEVEIIAPGQLLKMDTSAIALSGQHPLGNGLSILWRLGTHRQGSIYRRNSIGLSIAGEF